jgi:hypothetical protein
MLEVLCKHIKFAPRQFCMCRSGGFEDIFCISAYISFHSKKGDNDEQLKVLYILLILSSR